MVIHTEAMCVIFMICFHCYVLTTKNRCCTCCLWAWLGWDKMAAIYMADNIFIFISWMKMIVYLFEYHLRFVPRVWYSIHVRSISQDVLMNLIICSWPVGKYLITYSDNMIANLLPHLPGVNELTTILIKIVNFIFFTLIRYYMWPHWLQCIEWQINI